MEMPFGKHKGEEIEDLPSSYIKWLTENMEDEEIRLEAGQEYQYREDYTYHHE